MVHTFSGWSRIRVSGLSELLILLLAFFRLAMHGERDNKHKAEDAVPEGAVPAYLLDREATTRAKVRLLLAQLARLIGFASMFSRPITGH